MHPVPGVRYGSYVLRHREVQVWTCRIHDDHYDRDYYEDDYERAIEFDFPVYGCTCDTSARWRGTGEWEYVMEGILGSILRDLYLPPIIEQLNNDTLLGELFKDKP